jgi:hypothetical protein
LEYWTDAQQFQRAIFGLLTFYGEEDPRVDVVHNPFSTTVFDRFILNTARLNSELGIEWPTWQHWVATFEANLTSMKSYVSQEVGTAPEWHRLWWEQAWSVRQLIGYRMPEISGVKATSHYANFVESLIRHPERLAMADEWARRVSRSGLLSELIASGVVTEEGILEHATPWVKERDPLRSFFGMDADHVSGPNRCPC